jgi:hypothetical protein
MFVSNPATNASGAATTVALAKAALAKAAAVRMVGPCSSP